MEDYPEKRRIEEEGKAEDKAEQSKSDFLLCTTPASLAEALIETNISSKHYPTLNTRLTLCSQRARADSSELNFRSSLC